jgi:stress response protein YsnF
MTEYGTAAAAGAADGATLSAFFDEREQAIEAMERLRAHGVSEDRMRLTEGAGGPEARSETQNQGFFEALGDFLFPNEDRAAYAEGLSRGGYLVTVRDLSPELQETAMDVLEEAGAVDVDEREAEWRAQGWAGAAAGVGALAGSAGATGTATGAPTGPGVGYGDDRGRLEAEDETVQVVEERLRVGKRDARVGRVRVRSYLVEEPVREEVELAEERVEIERRPVDRPLEAGEDAFRERSIEAEERAEEPVISKEARVVEEIGLRRERETRRETISDTVRRTEVEIEDERDAADPSLDRR